MISREILEKAAERDIIQRHQIDPLLAFVQNPDSGGDSESREEPLKFIRSFGDVFITLGVVLLAVAINMISLADYYHLIPVAGFVLVAEWLVRVRRLSLPGIAILLAILFFVNKAIAFDHENATIFGLAILSLTSLTFYLRYRMPFSLLPLAAGLVAIGIIQSGADIIRQPLILAAFGLVVFAVAIWFDIRDTARVSHLSDSAFWLHLLAAPLIVHGSLIALLLSNHSWIEGLPREMIIIAFFVGILLLALLLDRRAMLVSTQLYMIYALTRVLSSQLDSGQNILIYTLMALGLFIIFFGSYWYKTRRLIFGFLSGRAISRFIPDLELADVKR